MEPNLYFAELQFRTLWQKMLWMQLLKEADLEGSGGKKRFSQYHNFICHTSDNLSEIISGWT